MLGAPREHQARDTKIKSGLGYSVSISLQYFSVRYEGNPCSDTYRGDSADSEAETKAYQALFDQIKGSYSSTPKAYVSLHSYSQKIISSYAASYSAVPEDPDSISDLTESGRRVAEAMTNVYGNKYQYGQARDIMYPASGSTKDWVLATQGVPLAWTWELRYGSRSDFKITHAFRDTGLYGFLLPPDQIYPQFDELIAGMIALFEFVNEN